ncbi:MAG: geranylgeranyl reductase family protein [Roseiarcus sp.]
MSARGRFELIVVGMGPAGASAAGAAAKRGMRVLGLDRKRVAGAPVQCAEFVPGPLRGEIADLTRAVRQPVNAMMTMVGDEDSTETLDFRGAMIDRATFDSMLVDAAEKAGAQIRLGAAIKSIGRDGLALQDGRMIDAGIVIGADGPRSLVGKAMGAVNAQIVETRQVTVPLRKPHQATDIFLSPDYRGGYAWLFPKGEVAHIGLGLEPALRHRLKPLLSQLHAKLVAQKRVGPEILALTGGAIPVGGMLRAVGRIGGRVAMLAGDAAGLTNPVTGAGIAAAVVSGRMAGTAAA